MYGMKCDKTVRFQETTPLYFSPYTTDVSPRNMVCCSGENTSSECLRLKSETDYLDLGKDSRKD